MQKIWSVQTVYENPKYTPGSTTEAQTISHTTLFDGQKDALNEDGKKVKAGLPAGAKFATVLSILGSSKGPLTAVQIAEALLAINGDPPTEINIRRAVYRVRDHLPTRRVVQLVLDNPGKPVGASALKQDWLRIAACLHYLHGERIVAMSNVPVNHFRQQFWALADRAAEFWPSGVPVQSGMHLDSHHVFASLRSTAAKPLTAHEIACAMKREGKGGSIELQILRNRVEKCLKSHQRQKTIVRVPLPERGKNISGWLLPEHLPAYKAAVRQLNDALVGISASSSYSYPDTPRIFALLRAAINPPTGREIAFMLSKLKDNRRIKFICLYQRVLRWLKHHEKQGAIIAVPLPERDVRLRGWRLAEDTSADARGSGKRKRDR